MAGGVNGSGFVFAPNEYVRYGGSVKRAEPKSFYGGLKEDGTSSVLAAEAELGRRRTISRPIVFAQFLKSFDVVRRIENWLSMLLVSRLSPPDGVTRDTPVIQLGWEFSPVVILMRGRAPPMERIPLCSPNCVQTRINFQTSGMPIY